VNSGYARVSSQGLESFSPNKSLVSAKFRIRRLVLSGCSVFSIPQPCGTASHDLQRLQRRSSNSLAAYTNFDPRREDFQGSKPYLTILLLSSLNSMLILANLKKESSFMPTFEHSVTMVSAIRLVFTPRELLTTPSLSQLIGAPRSYHEYYHQHLPPFTLVSFGGMIWWDGCHIDVCSTYRICSLTYKTCFLSGTLAMILHRLHASFGPLHRHTSTF
jgi:hypothetical protein